MNPETELVRVHPGRRWFVLFLLTVALAVLVWRVLDLHVFNTRFLREQGDARTLRVVTIPAHRGMISDRHGAPLAISTPVDSVWANPQELLKDREHWVPLARLLEVDVKFLERRLASREEREFVYLKRHVTPRLAKRISTANLPGIGLHREYQRYYPAGEVVGHLLGFTNVDDVGQEGIELAFDEWLRGTPGSKRVLQDRLRRTVEQVENLQDPIPGRDLALSIDLPLQYLAYRELKAAVQRHRAHSGSLVLLDVGTGEVLAMVNQPVFNPNNREERHGVQYRNRAITDTFEPGSTLKPFTVACALASGAYRPDTPIDTTPGTLRVGRSLVRDIRNYGLIDVATVLKKSSNVGASKIALDLQPKLIWNLLVQVGFGSLTGSGFPGEAVGRLRNFRQWRRIERATLAYGYGISVTPLQLAQAYTVLAGDGLWRPVSLLRLTRPPPGKQVLEERVANQVRLMLAAVVGKGGTGTRARVPGYRVAGKTGTVRKNGPGGYTKDRYIAVFAGMAPLTRPRLVMVVMIDEPQGKEYYGGQLAAPVFSRVMAEALRLLNIPPAEPTGAPLRMAYQG